MQYTQSSPPTRHFWRPKEKKGLPPPLLLIVIIAYLSPLGSLTHVMCRLSKPLCCQRLNTSNTLIRNLFHLAEKWRNSFQSYFFIFCQFPANVFKFSGNFMNIFPLIHIPMVTDGVCYCLLHEASRERGCMSSFLRNCNNQFLEGFVHLRRELLTLQ